jgi:hypothetical protein
VRRAINRSRTQDIRPEIRVHSRFTPYFICLLSLVLCLVSSFPAICYTLSVGHLPPRDNGHTFLIITDLSGLGPVVNIAFYDDTGHEVSTFRKLLPLSGKRQIDVEDYLQSIGTIVLESPSEQIAGEYWQISENGAMFMLPLQSPGKPRRYFANCFRFSPCSSNLLVLSDPYGSGPEVQMEFYSRTGELIEIARKLIRPYGTLAFEVNEYAPWDILGKVSIRSFRGSIVSHYRQLCDNEVIFATPARLPARELFVGKFSAGSGITSNLVLTDTSARGPATKIRFLSDTGVELFEKLLPPNGVVLIDPADYTEMDEVDNGIIQISSDTGIIADYWEKNPQTISYMPAIDAIGSELFISHFSPLDGTQNVLSLLSVGRKPTKVTIQFFNDDGKKFDSKEHTLMPFERVDELIDYYYDGSDLGTIIVRGTNANLMAAFHAFDIESGRHLGSAQARVIR